MALPTGTGSQPEGVSIAFDDLTLEPAPTWTRLDTNSLVASYSINRGRAFERDRTDASTATITINDRDGLLDPTNTSGTYYGKLEPLLQAAIALWDPVAEEWTTLFRGYIEDFDYGVHPSQQFSQLTISLVDAFAILSAIEMQPGEFGQDPDIAIPPATGNVFFEVGDIDFWIEGLLTQANWPTPLQVIFDGNVQIQPSVFSPGETVLAALQDAVDAEFPSVANVYCDKWGRVVFHGRESRFDPETVAGDAGTDTWDWHHWKAGDGAAVVASPTDTAHIRRLSFNRGLSKIINSALATPMGIDDADIEAQVVTDGTSIGKYGIRSWSAESLLTYGSKTGGLNVPDGAPYSDRVAAAAEVKRFAQYMVDNYADPRDRISELGFRSISLTHTGAEANWALLAGAEIGDLIEVTVDHPGGGGFVAEDFFIEGIHYEVTPLRPEYQNVTLTLDVSPKSYFGVGTAFGY